MSVGLGFVFESAIPLLPRASILLIFFVLTLPGRVLAQPANDREAESHALFVSGQEAADAGLWADAVELFQRSYELHASPAALFNLAVALRALGRHASARDALAKLLATHGDELGKPARHEAERLLADESRRLARLTLDGLQETTQETIRLDGEEREPQGQSPPSFELDPGPHRLVVQAPERHPFEWDGTLTEGQHLRLHVDLEPSDPMTDGAEGGSVLSSPWFWAAGVVVVGALVTGGVFLFRDGDQLDPMSDRVVRP